jgi:raffinose/stachyose/melibiose transport system permease protein
MLAFLAPAALLFTVVVLFPIATNAFYSLTDWSGFGKDFNVIWFDNFVRMAQDPDLLRAAGNTLVFTLVNTPLQILVGLGLALVLQRPGRLSSGLRLVIILPIAISGVVLGFLGSLIFSPGSGLLAVASEVPGFEWLGQNWLGDPTLAMGAVIIMNVWQWSGLTMLIFIAGLVTQPADLHEAARIDGAGTWQRFRHVTWPLLAPAVTINTVLTVIGGLKVFDIIYVLTSGGPAGATESIVSRVALQATFGRYGYSAAANLTLTVAVIVVSFVLLRLLRRNEQAS